MNTIAPLELDVREELRKGGEPLPRILEATRKLAPGQSLCLRATFEPIPLYSVLARKGYSHESKRFGEGDWEVLFTPDEAARTAPRKRSETAADGTNARSIPTDSWPAPKTHLDNRGFPPPEPMMRILEALEHLSPGEVLAAITEREPMFLYPELEQRGAEINVRKEADGVYLLIRRRADG
ncbi:MAG: DUF2249 domain-containing protein [Acetobacteraceae bacterium]